MNSDQDQLEQYNIDKIFFIGTNAKTNAVVYIAKHKQTKKLCAIRYFNGPERPPYVQWCEHKIINNNREVLPYFSSNFYNTIGSPSLDQLSKYKFMHKIASKLADYHAENPQKIHGNIHPHNILVSKSFMTVEFVDSLKGGNRKTYYSSPEGYKGINHQASDIYSLGLCFLQLLDQRLLEDHQSKLLQIRKPPHMQPLFPQDCHLNGIKDDEVKELINLMLNRSYLERIKASEVVAILRAIILNLINNNKQEKVNLSINHVTDYFSTQFYLIAPEKKDQDSLNSKSPVCISNLEKKIFAMYSDNKDLTFCKNQFTFIYVIKSNLMKILYNHPAGMELQVEYRQSELPKEVREKMGIKLLILILYHTPPDMFQLCLSGKLVIRISNNYNQMFFGAEEQ